MDSMDVPNNSTLDRQTFKPKAGPMKFALLSELTGIVERIERSSALEVLSKLPGLSVPEVTSLIESYYPPSHRTYKVEVLELSLLLQQISSQFKEEEQSKAQTSDKEVLTVFTLFPKLPIELRCKVWTYSIPGPRIIEIYNGKLDGVVRSIHFFSNLHIAKATHKVLGSLLAVNTESRDFVASRYNIIRGRKLGILSMSKHSVFLVDKKRDILYFNNTARTSLMPFMLGAKEIGSVNIRSFALPFHSFTSLLGSEKSTKTVCQLLLRLENLEKLMLVRVPGDSQHKNNGCLLEFFDHRTKDTLEDPFPPHLFTLCLGSFSPFSAIPFFAEDDPKFFGFYKKIVQDKWNNFLAQNPFMKPLEKVVLVFVKAKVTGPPRVSSDKLMLMMHKEREGLGN